MRPFRSLLHQAPVLLASMALPPISHCFVLFFLSLGLSVSTAAASDQAPPERASWAADEVIYDQQNDVITAEGNVEVTYEGNTLYADKVVYNRITDEVSAHGDIRLVDRNNNVVTAEALVLSGDLRNGVIEGLLILFRDGERLAANQGERIDGDRNILDMAVYSPCSICDDKGEFRQPVWQIKARRVIHNEEKQTLTYRDAYLELLGVPILYTPWLRHPDATVKRASGFLTPGFGQSSILGLTFELPYFWNIAPNMDATITPLITTDERAVLFGEFRHRIRSGSYVLSGSATYVTKRDNEDNPIPGDEFRGHFFGNGVFDLNEDWRWGFDLAVASDDTYLRRYNISRADSLVNHIYVERFWTRSYLSIGGYAFQGLREEDVAGDTPFAIPLVEYSYVGRPGWLGGRFGGEANLLMLTRTKNADTGRLSLGGYWRLPYTSPFGELYNLTLGVRGDAYFLNDFRDIITAQPDVTTPGNDFEGRIIPYAALEWKLPFLRQGKVSRQIIEPIVMIVASPNGANNNEIPNEDSQSFDLDTTNLFAIDRFSGYDRWESGVRVAYGVELSHYTDGGVRASLLVGQSYRFRRDLTMPADSGLQSRLSDVVMTASLNVPEVFDYYHRLRFDKDNFDVVRNEGLLAVGPDSLRLYLGYTQLKRDGYDPSLGNRQELRVATRIKLSQYWSMNADFSYDFERNGGALTAGGGLTYEDECLRFRISARRDFTEDRDVPPSTSIGFQIVFKVVADPASTTSRLENNQYNPTLDGPSGPFNRIGSGL